MPYIVRALQHKPVIARPSKNYSRRRFLSGLLAVPLQRHLDTVQNFQRRLPPHLISLAGWKVAQAKRPGNIRGKNEWNNIMRGLSQFMAYAPNTNSKRKKNGK